MTIIHSSDLGWKAGQDISQEFAAIAKTFKPGDVFVFDHMYDISGSKIWLPDNFTLAGGAPGAGIDVVDSGTNNSPLFFLGHSNTIVDLTVTHSNSPQTDSSKLGANAKVGVDYHNKRTFVSDDKDNLKVLNSYFEGNVSIMLDVIQGRNFVVQDTEFNGGYTQIRFGADVRNPTIDNTLFQNSLGDGIKTLLGSNARGTKDATITDSVFLNNLRDGLDTTGGFKDSIVSDSYFVGNGVSGIDFKTGYNSDDDFAAGGPLNENIVISNSEFIDNSSAVVVTTLNKFDYLNTSNAKKWAIQNILLKDSIVENRSNDGSYDKMFLVKDSYDIHWENVELLGNVNKLKTVSAYNIGLPQDINGTGLTTGNARLSQQDSYYQNLAGPDWSDISYPTDGTVNPPAPDPIVTPDPISYDPTPDPVVEDPAPTPDPVDTPAPETLVDSASDLLNVFIAFTDTDKDVVQIGEGSSVDSGLLNGRPLTIYAESQSGALAIGSVKLEIPGVKTKVENVAPYALFGDKSGDFVGNLSLEEGTYTVKLTVYGGKNGSGKVLEKVSFDFTVDTVTASIPDPAPIPDPDPVVENPAPIPDPDPVVENPTPTPDPNPVVVLEKDLERDSLPSTSESQILDISLVDTKTDKVVAELSNGAKLSKDDISGKTLSISAEAFDHSSAEIGSVRLQLDGKYNNVENVAPYALFGDKNGDFLGGQKLSDGTHFATITAYSGKSGKGSIIDEVTIQFQVGDYDSVLVDGKASTVSSYSKTQDKGRASFSEDPSFIRLEDSAWKSLSLYKKITELTVMKIDYKSDAEGEIQGVGFSNSSGSSIENTFFQLGGSQQLGIQAFNGEYETGSGFDSYVIPVGQFFTGEFDELVLVNDDDVGLGSSSIYDNISFYEAVA